jgi:hypothetical protein
VASTEGYHAEIRALADDTEQEQLVLADNGRAAGELGEVAQAFKDTITETADSLASIDDTLFTALTALRTGMGMGVGLTQSISTPKLSPANK